jgi:hypothetical protein
LSVVARTQINQIWFQKRHIAKIPDHSVIVQRQRPNQLL